ncbi:MAG TPA: putative sulfate exporter family transporter, partial [Enterovirga sp.]
AMIAPRLPADGATAPCHSGELRFAKLVPWFILGFLALAAFRSLGVIPEAASRPLTKLAGYLTVVSMAALGLGVDIRVLARAGTRVTVAVAGSLAVLLAISLCLIWTLRLG